MDVGQMDVGSGKLVTQADVSFYDSLNTVSVAHTDILLHTHTSMKSIRFNILFDYGLHVGIW